jgi:hypothetical protein
LRVPVKIAQEQLGHSSITTTLNIYTHVIDASHRTAIEALERNYGQYENYEVFARDRDRIGTFQPVEQNS